MELVVNCVLLTLLALITLGIVRVRNLFGVVVLLGAYSFLMASVMMVLDAVDVAMTEAAVGAGVSTVLLLAALHLTTTEEARPTRPVLLPLVVAIGTAGMLIWGTLDLPPFGAAATPLNAGLGQTYVARIYADTHVDNMVGAILASYRGFDTLGETVVVVTAGLGVLMLLARARPGPGADG